MARHSDPELEDRILQAARKLWHDGGEEALSMRAVAKAAGTNTPAVYRRFRTREDILRALVTSYQQQLYRRLVDCKSVIETAETFLDFSLSQPREYELIMSGLLARMTDDRPNLNLLAHRCAEWFGGVAREQYDLVLAIAALAHGTAMLTISGVVRKEHSRRAHDVCLRSLEVLAKHREALTEG
jgi:AcrR family transcriptional regulator